MNLNLIPLLLVLVPAAAQAEAYYPSRLAPRLLGTSQGQVGDCESEADVNSLEQAFALRGLPVRLSLFYRHAFNRRDPNTHTSISHLDLNAGDQQLMTKIGGILPEYMWPEDGRGYPEVTSKRPHPSQMIVYDPELPNTDQFGFKIERKTLSPNFLDSIDLGTLRRLISSGEALTLSIHGALLQPSNASWSFDHQTGLIRGKYSLTSLYLALGGTPLKEGVNHAVQIVGFDDQLYADGTYNTPGAILIRNSWNTDELSSDTLNANPIPGADGDLRKFRLKLHSTNLPGFYAIPMQYLMDMISLNFANIKILTLNYQAYSDTYLRLKSRYQIFTAPFACEKKNPFDADYFIPAPIRESIKNYRGWVKTYRNPKSTPDQIKLIRQSIQDLSQKAAESLSRPWFPKEIYYATLSSSVSGNRVNDFYSGKFTSYYCNGDSGARLWPTQSISERSLFRLALTELSLDVGDWHLWNKMFFALEELGADHTP